MVTRTSLSAYYLRYTVRDAAPTFEQSRTSSNCTSFARLLGTASDQDEDEVQDQHDDEVFTTTSTTSWSGSDDDEVDGADEGIHQEFFQLSLAPRRRL